jgi:hypothetical protein
MRDDEIVRLATAGNRAEGEIWRQALKEEGISCKVVGDYLEAGFIDAPGLRPEIWVHRADLARATAVLEAHRAATETETEDAEEA